MLSEEACLVRESTGTSAVAAALACSDVARLLAGGLAVREHGYPRVTTDVLELILRRKLPRGLAIVAAVRHSCLETWDALQAEK